MNSVKTLALASGAFLAADFVAKSLPPTPVWALGWGAIATAGTFMASRRVTGDEVTASLAATGVALAYLHAYTHQTPFPHRAVVPGPAAG